MIHKLTQHTIVRYVLAGGTSACVNLATLYVLHYIFFVHDVLASIVAFMVSFGVSFVLHKFWTFRNQASNNTTAQSGMYLISSLLGLALNTLIFYVAVHILLIPVIMSQIIAGGLVASCTFFISKYVIFKQAGAPTFVDSVKTFL